MATLVKLPKQGLQMTEGTIVQWFAQEGSPVTAGEPLFEMETDKLTITIDSPATGILLKIIRDPGDTVPITETIALIGQLGETADISGETVDACDKAVQLITANADIFAFHGEAAAGMPGLPERIIATPRARTIAKQKGIDIAKIIGNGPGGLITEADVIRPGAPEPPRAEIKEIDAKQEDDRETIIEITGMSKAIADNMMRSVSGMAQLCHRIQVDMTKAVMIRDGYKEKGRPLSYTDLFIYVVSRALMVHPRMNAWLIGDRIYQKQYVNMGVAVALEEGLVVPTLFNTHTLSLSSIHEMASDKIDAAKKRRLEYGEDQAATFTISNLGMYGLDEFDAIINPPQVGILAVGRVAQTAVVVQGQVTVRPVATLSLTYDHRALDGAPAAMFLKTVKDYMEEPFLLMA